jgi:hypothetical protein
MHKVRLINRVASHGRTLFPVCGVSTKNYGQAVLRPEFQGFVFEMPLEDYERDKFDIIGQTQFQQIWVPEFVLSGATNDGDMRERPALQSESSAPPTQKPRKEKTLIERAKSAGVWRTGMSDEEIKVALGFPD